MSRWEPHRSSAPPGIGPEPNLSAIRSSLAASAASTRPRPPPLPSLYDRHAISRDDPTSYFYTHPARVSVLDADGGLDPDTAALLPGFAGPSDAMQQPTATETSTPWRQASNLPSFSRAFDLFAAADHDDAANQEPSDRFFVPSYLESSTYMQKLEEAHQARMQAKKESKRSARANQASNGTGFTSNSLPSGTHRGLSHTVIERPAAFPDKDALSPLPTRWNKEEISSSLEIHTDGLGVKFSEGKIHHQPELEACGIRADNYMPPQCGIYYYEVQILAGRRDDTFIAIGFSYPSASTTRPVGWEPDSWGYHADDGRCFSGQNTGRAFGPVFTAGDVIGCGVNFRDRTAFYTKNGIKIATAFHDITRGKLYPTVSLKRPGEHVLANFGQTPFVYNIDDMMKEQHDNIQRRIDLSDTSQLEPGLGETDLIQALVMQFLQHDGYVETAKAFSKDLKLQTEALTVNAQPKAAAINIRDDEDADNRQCIRRAILEGRIDIALDSLKSCYPRVLQDNEQVYFKLRCRKFIEMVRKAALLNMANDPPRSNGHAAAHDMDIDINGEDSYTWDGKEAADNQQNQKELMQLEGEMLEYGQTLQAEYATDPRKEVSKALEEIWSLVAYKNPLKEPQVSHLLDRKGRSTVAEEVNSAILSSLGKSSRAALEKVYAQTSVLLEELRQDGGDGAFVSVKDVLENLNEIEDA